MRRFHEATLVALLVAVVASGTTAVSVAQQHEPPTIDVAVTVDDLPRFDERPTMPVARIHQLLLAGFAKYHVPEVYGFVNGVKLTEHPEDRAALFAWLQAGHRLGNHTYSHRTATDPTEFLADVTANERVLERLTAGSSLPDRAWKVFRYPSLVEGQDTAARDRIRTALIERGYRIAPVTVDFFDWAYDGTYARCLSAGNDAAVAKLKSEFLLGAVQALRWSADAARRLTGRRVPQILLVHAAEFDALLAGPLFEALHNNGAHFVTLDAVLQDPLLAKPYAGAAISGDLFSQMASDLHVSVPPRPESPLVRLNQICR